MLDPKNDVALPRRVPIDEPHDGGNVPSSRLLLISIRNAATNVSYEVGSVPRYLIVGEIQTTHKWRTYSCGGQRSNRWECACDHVGAQIQVNEHSEVHVRRGDRPAKLVITEVHITSCRAATVVEFPSGVHYGKIKNC